MLSYIEILKAIATLLIFNSHLKGVYSSDILSFGGGFGLAIFFMVSGFLLGNIQPQARFIPWYRKRVIRLILPLLIWRFVEIAIGYTRIDSIIDIFHKFIFPGTWFGGAILLLYVLYWVVVKYLYNSHGTKILYSILIGLMILFLLEFITRPAFATFSLQTLQIEDTFSVETPYQVTQLVWFFCMIVGLLIRKNSRSLVKRKCCIAFFIFSVSLFFVIRKLQAQYQIIQMLLPLAYVGFALSIFVYLKDFEDKLTSFFQSHIGKGIKTVGDMSLEIFYTQFIWIYFFKSLVFPVNIFVIFVMTLISAGCLRFICNRLLKSIRRK